jgi:uncharacterized Zn-binding protein involved in type VI secretion
MEIKENNMNGQYEGVNWVKTQNADISKGFTTIIVDGNEVKFHGHKSNAQAWNFINKTVAKRGIRVINGTIITK